MNLPDDIVAKVTRDFRDAQEREFVLDTLSNLSVNDKNRVIRCVLFCAAGDIEMFRTMEELARVDYRDAIMNGEYEYPSCKRLRNFNEPFA